MRKTWLNQFTPEILSVFGKPTATNNGARSLHKQLKEDITKHQVDGGCIKILQKLEN